MELRIPFTTLIKIALAVLLAAIVVKLWPLIVALIFAALIAVMLDPVVLWLESHRVRRPIGVLAIAFVLFALLVVFFFVLVPEMGRQVSDLVGQLPRVLARLGAMFPLMAPSLAEIGRKAPQLHGLSARAIIETVTAMIFVLVVSLYLLVEGRKAYDWLVSFVPAGKRSRVDRTGREISFVVLSYLRGAVITATICAAYVLVVLTALQVPLALVLTVLAFVFDFVPVIGTIIMMVPATLLGLLVSPGRALLIAGAYLLYHGIEAYILIPRIYGNQMRVSTLAVLLAMAIGLTLQGIIGAVLALPIAAAYPIVERIWLREHLPADTVPRHEKLEKAEV